MVLEQKRLEVTGRIVGKLANGEVQLFDENEQIGRILLNQSGNIVELKNGYAQEQNKIYKYVTVTTSPDEKYVDCGSESGWC
ncbi:uncharacterized protein DUF2553 [Anoxybacillus vitaminiphilus]|uniref:Uncharacterized protein DUF2553 n=1 Tax=Paranoxybacillus vitaminiphilus TaxID=581036 RepID=A0A327YBW2_9BACL|nr:YusG family protein [Anoxybacillus vitaminiphilus]RAK18618.1 uncharacterized protein DUF2553 [Anoxybacillus vitaminiphilus]